MRLKPVRVLTVLGAALLSVTPAMAEWQKGVDALQRKDYPAAVKEFEEVTKTNPNYAGAYYMLGVAQRANKQLSQALENLRRAVELDSSQAAWKVELGGALVQAKQYQDALNTLSGVSASALKPAERTRYSLVMAEAASKSGQSQTAITALSAQVKAEPQNSDVHFALGVAYDGSGDEEKAYAEFKRAAELETGGDKLTQYGGEAVRLGKVLGRRSSAPNDTRYYTEAAAIAERLAQASPSLDHLLDVGECWMGAKQYDRAVSWFEKAQAKQPQNALVHFYKGQSLAASGKTDQAVAELREALKGSPDAKLRRQIYETLGYVFDKARRYDEATQAYTEAGNQKKVAEMGEKKKAQNTNVQADQEREKFRKQIAALRLQIEELEKLGQAEEVALLRQQLNEAEKALAELK